jgi:Holliday junction resolvase
MAINSRQKGKRGELALVNELKKHGYDVRRSQQYCGNTGDAMDIIGLQGIHIECKNSKVLRLREYLEQAKNDAEKATKGNLPAVFYKIPRGDWVTIMPLEAWLTLYGLSEISDKDELDEVEE